MAEPARGVTPTMTELAITLDEAQREEIESGRFVRVTLASWFVAGGQMAKSVLVGRARGALRVFANVCRHQAVPLDLGGDSPMTDDGLHLLCHSHGAMYRPDDGYCVTGPCRGERLFAMRAREDGDAIVVDVELKAAG